MAKKYRVIFVFAVLTALIPAMLVSHTSCGKSDKEKMQAQLDSLALANEKLQLANEFTQIDAEFQQYEGQQLEFKNDSLLIQYDEAKKRVQELLKELDNQKASNSKNREKIKQLEAEIKTLRDICRHYLEEIDRLNKENAELKDKNDELTQQNEELNSKVNDQTQRNRELTQTVQRAEKLNLTGISLRIYGKKGKEQKSINKAAQLGVAFTISPNNTAKAGMKDLYVRILSPEGSLLNGNGSFTYEGKQLQYTSKRSIEYANDEVSTIVYWDVNTSLSAGEYTVEIFCDGNRLASRKFTLKK